MDQKHKKVLSFMPLRFDIVIYFRHSEISNQLFKIPMRQQTTNRYIRTITRLLAFTLRAYRGNPNDPQIRLAPPISDCARQLLNALSTPAEAPNAIHRLIVAILSQLRDIPAEYQCPGSNFIMFDNVRLSGQIKDVEEIKATLSEVKWPFRASTFWETFERIKSIHGDVET
jgi:hypothetical protein